MKTPKLAVPKGACDTHMHFYGKEGTQAPGTYPQIFANTANIDGNLVALITTPNGLFADT